MEYSSLEIAQGLIWNLGKIQLAYLGGVGGGGPLGLLKTNKKSHNL